MVKTLLSLLFSVLTLGTLASCMDDPITFDEPVPQNIYRPNSIGFRFINYMPGSPTGSIRIYWSNSSSDAQPNFGGYVARILTFDSIRIEGTDKYIQRSKIFAEQVVSKTTFEAIFDNVPIDQEYVFAVWGMRNPDPAKPDSLILSRDSVATRTVEGTNKRILFDPRPLDNPTVIRAASINSTTVLLQWDKPATHMQGNILSYTVYYRDPSKLNDSSKVAGSALWTDSSMRVNPPGAVVGQGVSPVKEYEYWVKVVRIDSTQFYSDSAVIRWSGGEQINLGDSLGNGGYHLGQGLFFGNLQGRYSAKEVAPDDGTANLKIEDAGENIVVTGLNGTRFYSIFHGASTLEVAKFTAPLSDADYSEVSIVLPKSTPNGGWIIYAKLFGRNKEVSRLLLRGSGSSVVSSNNTVSVSLILQPKTSGADPLPYF